MKLRFGKSYHLIVGDCTFSPWVSLLMLISLWTMIPFPTGAQSHSQGQTHSPSQTRDQIQNLPQIQYNPAGVIEIETGGRLWIEGSASIVNYTCNAEQLSGNGNIKNVSEAEKTQRAHGDVAITVSVPVRTLECGKRAMNKDMYEALKSKKFPNINYRLLGADRITDSVDIQNAYEEVSNGDSDTNEKWMHIKTTGILEIAGVKDTTIVFVKGQVLDENRFQVKGSKEIDMKTFDVKPPTALMGLIKADSELTVHFNVTVKLKDQ